MLVDVRHEVVNELPPAILCVSPDFRLHAKRHARPQRIDARARKTFALPESWRDEVRVACLCGPQVCAGTKLMACGEHIHPYELLQLSSGSGPHTSRLQLGGGQADHQRQLLVGEHLHEVVIRRPRAPGPMVSPSSWTTAPLRVRTDQPWVGTGPPTDSVTAPAVKVSPCAVTTVGTESAADTAGGGLAGQADGRGEDDGPTWEA